MTGSICAFGFIPVRSEASEKSEMITQLLFGETFMVETIEGKWAKVRLDYDGYEGWIDAKLVTPVTEAEYNGWKNGQAWIVPVASLKLINANNQSMFITGGSRLVMNGADRNSFSIGNREFYLSGSITPDKKTGKVQEIAMSYLNTPYLWGGCSFFGIDCSGFTQVVYKIMGIHIPRDASKQVDEGHTISFVEEAVWGDLAFFDDEEGNITHVGICAGRGEIIHASGEVRMDKLDHQGIFNQDLKKYTHKLRVIKRIVRADEFHV